MILDKDLILSAAQAVTASAASENIIDQGAAGDAIRPLKVVVMCNTTADSATDAATLTAVIQTATDAAFTSPVVLGQSAAHTITSAALTAGGAVMKMSLPAGALRYLRVYYTAGTENLSAGKFDAFLVADVDQA